jgi:hypothetical protein
MSGGLAVKADGPAVARLGLDGLGAAGPSANRTKDGRISRSAAQAIRQPRDRLKGQPQERQHSARVAHSQSEGDAGTRDRHGVIAGVGNLGLR